jgi:SAM-dependent methyltransferase
MEVEIKKVHKNQEIIKHERLLNKIFDKPFNQLKKLNISCGGHYWKGWINADYTNNFKHDIDVNLDKLPLPFKTNTFDYVYSEHTLEHVNSDFPKLMMEFWRILKPNGLIEIRVPHFSHWSSLSALNHVRPFSINAFESLYNNTSYPYLETGIKLKNAPFKFIDGKLRYQRNNNLVEVIVKRNARYYIAIFLSYFANLSTNICENIWCYWFGGFQQMEIILQKRV